MTIHKTYPKEGRVEARRRHRGEDEETQAAGAAQDGGAVFARYTF